MVRALHAAGGDSPSRWSHLRHHRRVASFRRRGRTCPRSADASEGARISCPHRYCRYGRRGLGSGAPRQDSDHPAGRDSRILGGSSTCRFAPRARDTGRARAALAQDRRLHRLLTDKFAQAQWDNEFGYDRIRLSALETELLAPAQKDLSSSEQGPELAHLIDRLTARLGDTNVLRFMAQDSHVPEQASVAIPAASAEEFAQLSPPPERGRSSRASGAGGGQSQEPQQDSLAPARPLRLFERPERIDAIAEVPDGPPVR